MTSPRLATGSGGERGDEDLRVRLSWPDTTSSTLPLRPAVGIENHDATPLAEDEVETPPTPKPGALNRIEAEIDVLREQVAQLTKALAESRRETEVLVDATTHRLVGLTREIAMLSSGLDSTAEQSRRAADEVTNELRLIRGAVEAPALSSDVVFGVQARVLDAIEGLRSEVAANPSPSTSEFADAATQLLAQVVGRLEIAMAETARASGDDLADRLVAELRSQLAAAPASPSLDVATELAQLRNEVVSLRRRIPLRAAPGSATTIDVGDLVARMSGAIEVSLTDGQIDAIATAVTSRLAQSFELVEDTTPPARPERPLKSTNRRR